VCPVRPSRYSCIKLAGLSSLLLSRSRLRAAYQAVNWLLMSYVAGNSFVRGRTGRFARCLSRCARREDVVFALRVALRSAQFYVGMQVGSVFLGLQVGSVFLGLRVGLVFLGLWVGSVFLGLQVGSVSLGLQVGSVFLGLWVGSVFLR